MTTRLPSYKSQQFAGKIILVDGERKVQLSAPMHYRHFLNTICKIGDFVSLYITNKRPKRSEQQNRYYRLYLSLIALSSGHTEDELHTWAKGKFLTQSVKEVFGDKIREIRSTTDLTIGQFCEYLIKIEEATGIPLPDTTPFMKPLSHDEYAELTVGEKTAYTKMKSKIVIHKPERI
jgi:hypothetical protein